MPPETVPFHKPHWVHYTEWTPSLIRQSIKCAIKKADAIHTDLSNVGKSYPDFCATVRNSQIWRPFSLGCPPKLIWYYLEVIAQTSWAIFGKRRLNFEVSRFNKYIGKVAPRFRCNSSRDAHTFHFSVACLGFINVSVRKRRIFKINSAINMSRIAVS